MNYYNISLNNRSCIYICTFMIDLYQIYKLRYLTNNIKKSILKGILASSITIISYLSIIVFTTPNLPTTAAISAALQINYFIIVGLSIGTGVQISIISYRKTIVTRDNCKIKKKDLLHSSNTGNGIGTILSSFFSFFSLVPLGCCSIWLLILSYLPLAFGNGVSVFMINYSNLLSYVGLMIIFVIAFVSILTLHKDLKVSTNKSILFKDKEREILDNSRSNWYD